MMARKKKSDAKEDAPKDLPFPPNTSSQSVTSKRALTPNHGPLPSAPSLNISRNKHWKYISNFHGSWLQLPVDVLESLRLSNNAMPRPRPIDPAVFSDVVRIRRLVDEASDIAVRAANGTTSSALSNANNSCLHTLGGGSATGLDLGFNTTGSKAGLSKERKYRMRENAVQKLAQAYRRDEIAASVVTMQGASPLEDVARFVLQRDPSQCDAKYVHFFHEKIPSRKLTEFTSTKPLDDLVRDQPLDLAPLRTRALTNIFKENLSAAIQDLTEALSIVRNTKPQHEEAWRELGLIRALQIGQRTRTGRREEFPEGSLHARSLELQMLFQRAGVYLMIACRNIATALTGLSQDSEGDINHLDGSPENLKVKKARKERIEAQKVVRNNAKRALRDYISLLSFFDYTAGPSPEDADAFFQRAYNAVHRLNAKLDETTSHQQVAGHSSLKAEDISNALGLSQDLDGSSKESRAIPDMSSLTIPPPSEVHLVSDLFSSSPPTGLPPYPALSQEVMMHNARPGSITKEDIKNLFFSKFMPREVVTFHPLLTEVLHSVLLCHTLIQTPPKEHLRHAHMVARLVRVCDGYPIFLTSPSPARSDWCEVIRQAGSWLELKQSWEILCAPAPLRGEPSMATKAETSQQKKHRIRHQAIHDALVDERVVNEATYHASVEARIRRAEQDEQVHHQQPPPPQSQGNRVQDKDPDPTKPQRWTQDADARQEYSFGTERAESIARWIRQSHLIAPVGTGKSKQKRGRGGKKGADAGIGEKHDDNGVPNDKDVNGNKDTHKPHANGNDNGNNHQTGP